jgi:ERCC4-related helicase
MGNVFCGKCILKWLKTNDTCPLCRNIVYTNELITTVDNVDNVDNVDKVDNIGGLRCYDMSKENVIIRLILQHPDNKFIIFSSHDNSFTPIRNILNKSNIQFNEVKGLISTRVGKINDYKYGDTRVMFLNSSHNGAGINLQETDDIIIYHEMPNEILKQLIGRANRIGRKKTLNVHHLLNR